FGNFNVRAPQLTRLAREGLVFERAYVATSSCSPSRCSLLTSRYPHSHGAPRLHEPLPATQVTFVEKLRESGYWTALAGKTHIGKPTEKKFDLVQAGGGASGCEQWLSTLEKRPSDKPFLLWLAAVDPHRDYQPGAIDPPHDPANVVVPPYLADTPATRRDLALYYDEIGRLDQFVGRLLDELDRQKLAQNTVVMFLSDNGRPFPRCKTTLYDSGIQTPLIVRWPAQIKAGGRTRSLVGSIDIGPTLLELAGISAPPSFQGKSFAPTLREPAKSVRDLLFAEKNWHDFDDHARSATDGRFKYIRHAFTDRPLTPPADAVRSVSFQELRRLRDAGMLTDEQRICFRTPRPGEELFDLSADPHELRNLAADPAHATTLTRLRAALDEWVRATDDQVVPDR
ncbi:MAG TPA: sulfatase, partial [Pirellulaceae bacterium]|nr:sulfatase [Pirellulaceae bacterium]